MPETGLIPLFASDVGREAAAAAAESPRAVLPMVVIGLVLVGTFVFIAFDWMHKTLAALLGAVVAVILALLLGVFGGEAPYTKVHGFIHHDLSVLGVIVGTSIIVTIAGVWYGRWAREECSGARGRRSRFECRRTAVAGIAQMP